METMLPLTEFTNNDRRRIKGVFTDIDDTLTTDGNLTATAYQALTRLKSAGLIVIPVTGRPAGWCDHIARMWPVDGVVGENGAFYFRHQAASHSLTKRFLDSDTVRAANRKKLIAVRDDILANVPGTAIASDQSYREADLAIDFCEDVAPLPRDAVDKIVSIMETAGMTAKVSSIHVNGWYGTYDKLTMSKIMMAECFSIDLDTDNEQYVYVGDSENDAPMFEFFKNAVGVANVRDCADTIACLPRYVTKARSGDGFIEIANALIAVR